MTKTRLIEWLKTNPQIPYNEDNKAQFKKMGKELLHQVRGILDPYIKDSKYDFNPGGIAVSGDHSLRFLWKDPNEKGGMHIFFSLLYSLEDEFIIYRTVTALDDFTGGVNRTYPLRHLTDVREFCGQVLSLRAHA